jgi:outer membrane protein TolC
MNFGEKSMASHRITTQEKTKAQALKRNKMKRFVIKSLAIALVILAAFLEQVFAQDSLPASFTHEAFIDIVRNHHPMARAAQLKGQEGEFLIQSAKGGFDPKLSGNMQQKYFDGTNYYSYIHGGLKIPTWYGVTLQAGYDANTGARLNPEAYTSDAGLWNAGISVQLGNGLLIDQRRADLRQAEIYANSTELEQKLMLNQLELDASMAYYDWFKAYNYFRVFETAVENASLRLDNIRQAALFGDKASIDTLKALIFLQERQLNLERTRLNLQNKQAQLEIFLWQDGSIPLEFQSFRSPHSWARNDRHLGASTPRLFDFQQ